MGRAVERQKHFIELSVIPLRVEDETEETREVVLPVAKALGLVDVIADPVDGARERASVHKDLAPLVLDDLTQIPYERKPSSTKARPSDTVESFCVMLAPTICRANATLINSPASRSLGLRKYSCTNSFSSLGVSN